MGNQLKEARLQRIKDREAREQKRAEQEMIRLKKKEEEWARKREFEEARKKEREDKLKALQEAQAEKQRNQVSTGVNPLDIVKQNLQIAAAKKEQTDKAKELHERWQALEGEKYDIEMTFKKQDYDIRELLVRINEIGRRRRKTIHLGGSRRMQQDENEKTFLGVKGMADKYMNIVDEKNKQKPSKKIDLPKKQVSESEDFEEPEPEPEGDAEPAEVEVDE